MSPTAALSPPRRPDLRIASVSTPATNVVVGQRVTIHARTLNAGTLVAGPSITAYYLTRRHARRLRLGGHIVKRLNAGQAATDSLTASVPMSALGSYSVQACADDRDDRTPATSLLYDVYMATSPGSESYGAAPTATSIPGATSFTIGGLAPGRTYYFVVLARDASGNRSIGIIERSTATEPDTTPPVFSGLQGASFAGSGCSLPVPQPTCHVVLQWTAASDDFTPASGILYDIYVSSASGHENFTTPAFTTAPGATSYDVPTETDFFDYFVVRARDAAGNHDANTKEIQAIPPP